jgi:hypothetical protein
LALPLAAGGFFLCGAHFGGIEWGRAL